MPEEIMEILGKSIGYGSLAVGLAYITFRTLTTKWIESKFTERLNEFKHQQEIEVQRLRIEIDGTLDSVLRLQENEFNTLTEAWSKLDEAFGLISYVTSPFQSYADLGRMSGPELEEFFERTELFPTQKDKIRQSTQKNKDYQEEIYWHRIHKVKTSIYDLQRHVVRYGIFFSDELKSKFDEIIEQLISACSEHEAGTNAHDRKMQNAGWKKLTDESAPLRKEIESAIRSQLRHHTISSGDHPAEN